MGDFDDSDLELVHGDDDVDVGELAKESEDAPVVKLVNLILTDAVKKGASDIHIEPYEKEFRVRYRIDGVLYEVMKPPLKLKNAITSRLKIMSELDIAERRLPQDGRIKLKLGRGKEMDFRVSVLPTLFGEKIVLRLLDKCEPAARHDQARLRAEAARRLQEVRSTSPSAWCWSPAPPAPARRRRSTRRSPSSTRSSENISTAEDPGRVQPRRHQPGADARGHRPELRRGPALLPAPGPGHHHGRRDPRLRDRGDRRQGRAHRPPGALDAPHQRRAVDDQPAAQHGHRAVPGGVVASTASWPSASRAGSARSARSPIAEVSREALMDAGLTGGRGAHLHAHEGPRLPDLLRDRLQGPRRALRGDACSATSSRSSC